MNAQEAAKKVNCRVNGSLRRIEDGRKQRWSVQIS